MKRSNLLLLIFFLLISKVQSSTTDTTYCQSINVEILQRYKLEKLQNYYNLSKNKMFIFSEKDKIINTLFLLNRQFKELSIIQDSIFRKNINMYRTLLDSTKLEFSNYKINYSNTLKSLSDCNNQLLQITFKYDTEKRVKRIYKYTTFSCLAMIVTLIIVR